MFQTESWLADSQCHLTAELKLVAMIEVLQESIQQNVGKLQFLMDRIASP